MGKRNRIRYQSKGNQFPRLTLTGKIFLKYEDEEAVASAVKGDVMLYLSSDQDGRIRQGDYDSTGHAGYFKADVHDGREWRPLAIGDFFKAREYYYSKTERPIDTCAIVRERLAIHSGRELERTYREHYQLAEE